MSQGSGLLVVLMLLIASQLVSCTPQAQQEQPNDGRVNSVDGKRLGVYDIVMKYSLANREEIDAIISIPEGDSPVQDSSNDDGNLASILQIDKFYEDWDENEVVINYADNTIKMTMKMEVEGDYFSYFAAIAFAKPVYFDTIEIVYGQEALRCNFLKQGSMKTIATIRPGSPLDLATVESEGNWLAVKEIICDIPDQYIYSKLS